ncbi:hypothetical protein ACEPAI_9632 [Sanghuangporus weigelae]
MLPLVVEPSNALRIGRQEREAEREARKQANPDTPMDPKVDYEKGIEEPVARLVGVGEDMSWEKHYKAPVVLEGFQYVDDTILAAEAGVDFILISSHGGGYSPYMDEGVRPGTDGLKALCLGAKAFGIGRPFLYAQSVAFTDLLPRGYGDAGMERLIRILETEINNWYASVSVTELKNSFQKRCAHQSTDRNDALTNLHHERRESGLLL